jgi:hypothetical protein
LDGDDRASNFLLGTQILPVLNYLRQTVGHWSPRLYALIGIDPRVILRNVFYAPKFARDLIVFSSRARRIGAKYKVTSLYPILGQNSSLAGEIGGHYFFQDLFVAKRLLEENPRRHIDVGSRIDGFVAHVACARGLDVVDVRPVTVRIPNVRFRQLDMTKGVPAELRGAYDSASCLHALEHFGLGRYGDELDPRGCEKGLQALSQLLSPRGRLYQGAHK